MYRFQYHWDQQCGAAGGIQEAVCFTLVTPELRVVETLTPGERQRLHDQGLQSVKTGGLSRHSWESPTE